MITATSIPNQQASAKAVKAFLILAMSYLLFGLLLGVIGGFQYILPPFLKSQLSFQQTRPLHVYLVITWIFTAAQAGIYYYLPRISNRPVYWSEGVWVHFILQLVVSVAIISSFFLGYFGGREYLEFPPLFGAFLLLSWMPFVINFFLTLRPKYKTAPVYIWMWSTGILFFFITVSESYLWLFEHFKTNVVRDITIQWKALGSMVGSWNMLVYGTGMYVMEQTSSDNKTARSPLAFFFYFLGLTNLMFNWGHHTYIVPAAPWVKTVAYVISMTELLILAHIIWHWRKTMTNAKKNYHSVSYRLLSFADVWILLNLVLAICISVPALNIYTHGTHITVAHAMGTTIGINTMILFASIFFIARQQNPVFIENNKIRIGKFLWFTNISLLIFWLALLGMGLMKIFGNINNQPFGSIMEKSNDIIRLFSFSGVLVMTGLFALIFIALKSFPLKKQ
ncbi:MAG TPA: cbb3-type cytochrome c oxidase subunit I [Chitinophagaceae bacterium]|nr:cbb3-type cytochrome c oxidase subunit I [Chitinophagaceae bacterium]